MTPLFIRLLHSNGYKRYIYSYTLLIIHIKFEYLYLRVVLGDKKGTQCLGVKLGMLRKDFKSKCPVEKRNIVRGPQGVWRQDELIGSKPPVVK
jgi:hypothetical protein